MLVDFFAYIVTSRLIQEGKVVINIFQPTELHEMLLIFRITSNYGFFLWNHILVLNDVVIPMNDSWMPMVAVAVKTKF